MDNIFNLFKRRNEIQTHDDDTGIISVKENARETLESAKESLDKIEVVMFKIKEQDFFVDLLAFNAYYSAIVQFYRNNIDAIISVNELLLLKYIDMVYDILDSFDERYASREQKEEFSVTLDTINQKLYTTIQNIKEQQSLDLNVDLKTIRDLIKLDF